ncbi:HlyD family efflux transporter periplasmic adaptor subunit [Mastigocladopsis repens]|uniref:HlyD family efflux transporter periplasmic adaptor subunit n=1 Tax=Mastigocladopsis repens TaxID=221287 RepID=UPI001E59C2F6|nr:HlyD family efflux transporter periplasmic adaptor subunit [Mastigocladopsis repens]
MTTAMSEMNGIKFEEKPLLSRKVLESEIKVPIKFSAESSEFTPSVVLRQSPLWSRAILWGLIGMTTLVVIWANLAKIEEAIPAQGKLEPQGSVKEVQTPVNGVVKTVYVQEGQKVHRGDILLRLDPTAARSQLLSLQKIRNTLRQEIQFYRAQLIAKNALSNTQISKSQLNIPPGLAPLSRSRMAVLAENQLYRAQLGGVSQNIQLAQEEEARLEFSQAELNSRVADVELETEKLKRQLSQAQSQLSSAQEIKTVSESLLKNIETLAKEGGISRLQYLQQKQQVIQRQAEVEHWSEEQARLKFAIAQSKQKLQNTIATAKKDLLTKIADNDKQIATLNSEFNKAIIENEKQIAQLDAQISQAQLNLKYQELRSPTDGVVFDLQAISPGSVTNSSQPILKIVPEEALTAKVYISNKDIGFVKKGMKVDVRIDSFPFSEFGDIKGKLDWVGSDSLPPEQSRPYDSFPAKIRLYQQSLLVENQELPLRSGMSVTVNIKVRDRTVMSIFSDLFTKQIDSLKTAR